MAPRNRPCTFAPRHVLSVPELPNFWIRFLYFVFVTFFHDLSRFTPISIRLKSCARLIVGL